MFVLQPFRLVFKLSRFPRAISWCLKLQLSLVTVVSANRLVSSGVHTIRKVKFLSKNSIWTKPKHFHEFLPKFFLTIFLVKLKLSTAEKSKTTSFSRVFHPKNRQITFFDLARLKLIIVRNPLIACLMHILFEKSNFCPKIQFWQRKAQHFYEFFTKFFWQFFSWYQSCQQLKSPKTQQFDEIFFDISCKTPITKIVGYWFLSGKMVSHLK